MITSPLGQTGIVLGLAAVGGGGAFVIPPDIISYLIGAGGAVGLPGLLFLIFKGQARTHELLRGIDGKLDAIKETLGENQKKFGAMGDTLTKLEDRSARGA